MTNHYKNIHTFFQRASAHAECPAEQLMEECVNKYCKELVKNALETEKQKMREEMDEEIRKFREGFSYKPKPMMDNE